MASIFNVVYNVQTTSKSDGGLEKIISLIEKMGGQIEAINKTPIKPSGDTSGVDKVSKKLQEQDSIFKDLIKTAGAYLAFGAIKEGISTLFNVGSSMENIKLRLNNLMGGAKEGGELFAKLQEKAVASPYDLDLLVNANAGLISAGESAQKAGENIDGLQNAIAYAGKGNAEFQRMAENLTQIKTLGKASGADIKQFATAGINIYPALAKSMNLPIEKIKEMEISYEDITKALNDASKAGGLFAGGTEALLAGSSTKLSNMGDSIKNTITEAFVLAKPAIDFVITSLGKLAGILGKVFLFLQKNNTLATLLAITFGTLTLAITLFTARTKIAAVWSGIMNGFLILQKIATLDLTGAMIAAGIAGAGMWIAITGGLILVAGGIYLIVKNFDKIKEKLMGFWELLKALGENILIFFKDVGSFFEGLFTGKTVDYEINGKYNNLGDAYNQGVGEQALLNKARKNNELATQVGKVTAKDVSSSSSKVLAKDAKTSLASSAQGATSSVKNITINLEALQKIQEQYINNKNDSKKILSDMNLGLIEILNNTSQTK